MFNEVKWERYKPLNQIDIEDLKTLDALIKLIFPTAKVDYVSNHAKLKLKIGVITLTDGLKVECYPLLDLLIYRMAPMLFSNNHYYINSYRKTAIVPAGNPVQKLAGMVKSYNRLRRTNTPLSGR